MLDACIRAAGSALSGANLQPWHFVVVTDAAIKTRIRKAAEAEEREFSESRATPEWLAALEPLGTDANKPFLETAPALIAIFAEPYGERADGTKEKHHYASESVGVVGYPADDARVPDISRKPLDVIRSVRQTRLRSMREEFTGRKTRHGDALTA